MKTLCDIYRSSRDQDLYLYVEKQQGLARVSAELLKLFGKPIHVTTLLLTPTRKLARAEISKVLSELHARGYYLQMPLSDSDEMNAIAAQNSKLPR